MLASIRRFQVDNGDPPASVLTFVEGGSGLPAITVPCGLSKEKLPFGVQFIGRALNDQAVISTARLYQEKTDWHRLRPPGV
jgi:aspartyl-tRNA(Asn)/glutamyl-tRNA(Gln) amidotransferase subunit A